MCVCVDLLDQHIYIFISLTVFFTGLWPADTHTQRFERRSRKTKKVHADDNDNDDDDADDGHRVIARVTLTR